MKNVFVSYSRKDVPWVKRLYEHLRPLTATGDFELWTDADIALGENWRTAVQRSIESASAVVLIISPDYLASDFIANIELPSLLRAAQERALPIYPILVRPVAIAGALGALQTVNPDGEPLNQLPHWVQEEVMAETAKKIGRLAETAKVRHETRLPTNPHAKAISVAISQAGATGSINVGGVANIFVDAERRLQGREDNDGR